MSLCKQCNWWVDCETKGFCNLKDLFTYTDEDTCEDFQKGTPMPDWEWEQLNDPSFWKDKILNK